MAEPVVTIDLEFVMMGDVRLNVSIVEGRDTVSHLHDRIIVACLEDPERVETIDVMLTSLLCMRSTRRILEP